MANRESNTDYAALLKRGKVDWIMENRILSDRNDDYQSCLTEVFELVMAARGTDITPEGVDEVAALLKQAAQKIIDVGGIVAEDGEVVLDLSNPNGEWNPVEMWPEGRPNRR